MCYRFLHHPVAGLYLELMRYHYPGGDPYGVQWEMEGGLEIRLFKGGDNDAEK